MQPSVRILPQMVRTHPRKKYSCVHICAHRRKILSGVNEVLEFLKVAHSQQRVLFYSTPPTHIHTHTHTTSTRQFYMWAASFLLFPHTPLHLTLNTELRVELLSSGMYGSTQKRGWKGWSPPEAHFSLFHHRRTKHTCALCFFGLRWGFNWIFIIASVFCFFNADLSTKNKKWRRDLSLTAIWLGQGGLVTC